MFQFTHLILGDASQNDGDICYTPGMIVEQGKDQDPVDYSYLNDIVPIAKEDERWGVTQRFLDENKMSLSSLIAHCSIPGRFRENDYYTYFKMKRIVSGLTHGALHTDWARPLQVDDNKNVYTIHSQTYDSGRSLKGWMTYADIPFHPLKVMIFDGEPSEVLWKRMSGDKRREVVNAVGGKDLTGMVEDGRKYPCQFGVVSQSNKGDFSLLDLYSIRAGLPFVPH